MKCIKANHSANWNYTRCLSYLISCHPIWCSVFTYGIVLLHIVPNLYLTTVHPSCTFSALGWKCLTYWISLSALSTHMISSDCSSGCFSFSPFFFFFKSPKLHRRQIWWPFNLVGSQPYTVWVQLSLLPIHVKVAISYSFFLFFFFWGFAFRLQLLKKRLEGEVLHRAVCQVMTSLIAYASCPYFHTKKLTKRASHLYLGRV